MTGPSCRQAGTSGGPRNPEPGLRLRVNRFAEAHASITFLNPPVPVGVSALRKPSARMVVIRRISIACIASAVIMLKH
jgi:hypothetical protein